MTINHRNEQKTFDLMKNIIVPNTDDRRGKSKGSYKTTQYEGTFDETAKNAIIDEPRDRTQKYLKIDMTNVPPTSNTARGHKHQ